MFGFPSERITLYYPSSRTMAMESTQHLTETSTRNLPGGKGRPAGYISIIRHEEEDILAVQERDEKLQPEHEILCLELKKNKIMTTYKSVICSWQIHTIIIVKFLRDNETKSQNLDTVSRYRPENTLSILCVQMKINSLNFRSCPIIPVI
jgi:hypothetical protein